ncbi:HAD-IA family hydrolase [Nocardia sp. NPDC050712]|uniref:HAD family hydrolase n=1 Tax=Nocardia sp. NPDC050712 TaxID=3155518 RepID=UPI0033E01BEA
MVPRLLAEIDCCIFDLDGTVTKTELQHRRAWHEAIRTTLGADLFVLADYHELDGLPPRQALREYLARRQQVVPDGSDSDPPGAPTVAGIVARKRELYSEILAREGAEPYPGTLRLLYQLRQRRVPCAVVSASTSCREVLDSADLSTYFQVVVDGIDVREHGLRGKPAPDCFLRAARQLRVAPDRCAVFEDAPSGVLAARNGEFGRVVAIDRCGQAPYLLAEQPDILLYDLAQLLS